MRWVKLNIHWSPKVKIKHVFQSSQKMAIRLNFMVYMNDNNKHLKKITKKLNLPLLFKKNNMYL